MKIIETKSRSNTISWIVYSLFGLLCLIGSPMAFIKILIEDSTNFLKLLPVFIIQFIVGILCLRMILWFIRGKESIHVIDDKLLIKKSGTFWIKKQQMFDLKNMKKVALNMNMYEEQSPSNLVHDFSRQTFILKIQNTGRINLIYSGFNSSKFLDNITPNEALLIIDKIKNAGKT